MKICPITYEEIANKARYSEKGLQLLSPGLKNFKDFPFSAEEQRQQAETYASKLSIQGVQPKMSAALSIKEESFELVERGGTYILKPQAEHYKKVPENEDLTMRLAKTIGIEVPLHGLIYSKDGSLTYFIKRFDRYGQKKKAHVEDFAQLSGASRHTKYDSTMEKVAKVIEEFCTFPAVEKLKLLQRTIFSFLVGNEDMHLKNFSLIVRDDKAELTPAYDFVNSTIVLAGPKEQLALPLKGRKNKLKREDLIDYFGEQRLGINPKAIAGLLEELRAGTQEWDSLIQKSFLSAEMKKKYADIVRTRKDTLGID
jgi:serine/threonine-protein kinase HipA